MKKTALTICLLAGMVSFSTGGCNYVGLVGGDESFTLELYSPSPDRTDKEPKIGNHDLRGAVGLLVITNRVKSNTFERSSEVGSFVKIGIEILPDTGLFVDGLIGLTSRHEYYRPTKTKTTEWEGLYGTGLTYFISNGDTCIIAGYDNRRGFTGGIGWRF